MLSIRGAAPLPARAARLATLLILLLTLAHPAAASPFDTALPNREYVVAVRPAPPFAMRSADGVWSGVSVELWRHVAEQLGLRYRLVEAGARDDVARGLADGRLDASVGAAPVTAELLRQADFSTPYFMSGIGVAVPRALALDWRGVVMSLFTTNFLYLLLALIGGVVLVAIVMWLIERKYTAYFGGPPSTGLVCSVTWSTQALARANNEKVAPTTRAGKLIGAAWTAAGVGLVALITAAVTSHLTARELGGRVTVAADLHEARVGSVSGTETQDYLDRAGIAAKAFPTLDAALAAVAARQIDAVVYDKARLAWAVRETQADTVRMLPLDLEPRPYAVALPFGSPLRERVNVAIMERVRTDWWETLLGHYVGRD